MNPRRAFAEALSLLSFPEIYPTGAGVREVLGVVEIERDEETEVLSLELRRARNESAAHLGFADPNAPAPQLAPTPAVSILDLPPLPSAEDDDRPRAVVFASPWFGAHHIYAGASATQRGCVHASADHGRTRMVAVAGAG